MRPRARWGCFSLHRATDSAPPPGRGKSQTSARRRRACGPGKEGPSRRPGLRLEQAEERARLGRRQPGRGPALGQEEAVEGVLAPAQLEEDQGAVVRRLVEAAVLAQGVGKMVV